MISGDCRCFKNPASNGGTSGSKINCRNMSITSNCINTYMRGKDTFMNVDFMNTTLPVANFKGKNVLNTDFENADLNGADFSGAYLENVSFKSNRTMSQIKFDTDTEFVNVTMPNGKTCTMEYGVEAKDPCLTCDSTNKRCRVKQEYLVPDCTPGQTCNNGTCACPANHMCLPSPGDYTANPNSNVKRTCIPVSQVRTGQEKKPVQKCMTKECLNGSVYMNIKNPLQEYCCTTDVVPDQQGSQNDRYITQVDKVCALKSVPPKAKAKKKPGNATCSYLTNDLEKVKGFYVDIDTASVAPRCIPYGSKAKVCCREGLFKDGVVDDVSQCNAECQVQ